MSTVSQIRRRAAYTRWHDPAVVDRRVDALADTIRRKIDALPPLTDAQRAKLAALLRPAERGGRGAA